MSRSAELGTKGSTGRAGSSGLQAPRATGVRPRGAGPSRGSRSTERTGRGAADNCGRGGDGVPGGPGVWALESQVEEESSFPRTLPGSPPRGRRPGPRGHRRLCHRLSPIAGHLQGTDWPFPNWDSNRGCWLSQAGVPLVHSGPGDSPRLSPGSLLAPGVSAPSPGPLLPARDPSQPLPAAVPSLGSPGSPTLAASLPPRRVPARRPPERAGWAVTQRRPPGRFLNRDARGGHGVGTRRRRGEAAVEHQGEHRREH